MTRTTLLFALLGLSISIDVAASTPVSSIAPTRGRAITAPAGAAEGLGFAVAGVGDIDGDGRDDVAIGAPTADRGGVSPAADSGAVYVVFGGPSSGDIGLASLPASAGFRVIDSSLAVGDALGYSVTRAGDVNGDGLPDILIGCDRGSPFAFGVRTSAKGYAWVLFGRRRNGDGSSSFGATVDLATLTSAQGFRIQGLGIGDGFGYAVAGGSDLNGDGVDDIAIGAYYEQNAAGRVYVVYGRNPQQRPFPASVDTSGASPAFTLADGFAITGPGALDLLGYSLSMGGDFNGDGRNDLLIGTPNAGNNEGAASLVFGRNGDFASNLTYDQLNGQNGVNFTGLQGNEGTGTWVAFSGDMNGDGRAEIALGAPYGSPNTPSDNRGRVWLVFGAQNLGVPTVPLGGVSKAIALRIDGAAANDYTGLMLDGGTDLNEDGLADLTIGAPDADTTASNAGRVYVLYGARNLGVDPLDDATAIASPFALGSLEAESRGETLDGIGSGSEWFNVAALGRFNEDAGRDLIVCSAAFASGDGKCYAIDRNPTGRLFGDGFD